MTLKSGAGCCAEVDYCAVLCCAVLCCAALDTSKAAVLQWTHQVHRHRTHAVHVPSCHLPGWQGMSCRMLCFAEPQTLNHNIVLQSHRP